MPTLNSPIELEAFRKEILSKRAPKQTCLTPCSGTARHAPEAAPTTPHAWPRRLGPPGVTKAARRVPSHATSQDFITALPMTVPGPATVGLLSVGALALLRRRTSSLRR